jgi:hypothetical protein
VVRVDLGKLPPSYGRIQGCASQGSVVLVKLTYKLLIGLRTSVNSVLLKRNKIRLKSKLSIER